MLKALAGILKYGPGETEKVRKDKKIRLTGIESKNKRGKITERKKMRLNIKK